MKKSFSVLQVLAFAVLLLGPLVGAETQTISLEDARHDDNWGHGPRTTISGIPIISSGKPGATMTFEVAVSEPGGTYQVFLPIVKAFNSAHIGIYFDGELQVEADTFSASNVPDSILITRRHIAPGAHTIKVKNLGQKKARGGNRLYVRELRIVGEEGAGKWQVRVEDNAFVFAPAKKETLPGYDSFATASLPPRAQKEPFSIPEGSDGGDIFSHSLVSVRNIPFVIPNVDSVPETGFAEAGPLEVVLSNATSEVFLLVWSKIPPVDGDLGPARLPIAPIDQSERFTIRLTYEDDTAEEMIPFDVGQKRYGLDNGIGLYVLHPDAGKVLRGLAFQDRTYKSSFALVALTCNRDKPISPEVALGGPDAWYPAVKRSPSSSGKVEVSIADGRAVLSDGSVEVTLDIKDGLKWESLGIPAHEEAVLDGSGLFAVRPLDSWVGSNRWKVTDAKALQDGVSMVLEYKEKNVHLESGVKLTLAGNGKIRAGLTVTNRGTEPLVGRVRFPILEGVRLGSLEDTWYFIPRAGAAVIHRDEVNVYAPHGSQHPLQVESFFNPKEWFALTLLSTDVEGQFHWYDVGKDEKGGWYRVEYLEKSLPPGGAWRLPECTIAVTPGDWRESFRLYREWVASWYTPKPAATEWFRESFVQGFWYQYANRDFATDAQQIRDVFGYCDGLNAYNWNSRHYPETGGFTFGEYDRTVLWPGFGGEEGLKASVKEAAEGGVPVSFYTNAILIHDKALHNGVPTKKDEWMGAGPAVHDGLPSYRPCLVIEEWLDYMVACERWLTHEIGAKMVYLDEFGDSARLCYSKKHGHDAPEPIGYGERELTRRIRAAVPDDVVIRSEEQPEDIRFQWQDSYYSGALGRSKPSRLVPVDMVRFAFPDIKAFNLIYGYSLKDGNWELLKFVLFNGSSYGMARSYDPKSYFEERSILVLRKLFRILHENADAFASRDVEPLIETEIPGVFVNRFRGEEKTVWTVYNANYRTAKGQLIQIAHEPGARYVDLWNDCPVEARVSGDVAYLVVEIGPRDVACISQVNSALRGNE